MPCNKELDSREIFVPVRAVKHWKRLPSKVVESPSLKTSEMQPDKALSD